MSVLEGRPYLKGNRVYLPHSVVARQQVGVNQTYRFALEPGDYVLEARYTPVNGMQSDVEPYTAVALRPGEALHRDIPNMCL